MSIKLVSNSLEGLYAVPDHPVTTANPGVWLIEEMKIKLDFVGPTIYIRNKNSMWFSVDMCFVGPKADCEVILANRK